MDQNFKVPPAWSIRARLRMRHLELLLSLGDLRSLHKAAARMNMTQPAASKLLQEVETMFGVPLFLRSRQGTIPTDFGSSLLQKASLLLAELDGARDEIESLALGASGRLRIGAQQVALPLLVPQTLAQLRTRLPNVAVLIQEGGNDVLLAALGRGELDCVLGRLVAPIENSNFHPEVLYAEPVVVVARTGHPLTKTRQISPATLARQAWILPPREAPLRHIMEQFFMEHDLALPAAAIESVSLLSNSVLMSNTDMVTVMPLAVARYHAEHNRLAILRFRHSWTLPPVGVVRRIETRESAALGCFLATLRTVAAELESGTTQEG